MQDNLFKRLVLVLGNRLGTRVECGSSRAADGQFKVQISRAAAVDGSAGSICCMITLPLFPFLYLYPLLVQCFVVGSFLCLEHLDLDGLSQMRMDLVGVALEALVKLAQETLVGPVLAILAGVLVGEA